MNIYINRYNYKNFETYCFCNGMLLTANMESACIAWHCDSWTFLESISETARILGTINKRPCKISKRSSIPKRAIKTKRFHGPSNILRTVKRLTEQRQWSFGDAIRTCICHDTIYIHLSPARTCLIRSQLDLSNAHAKKRPSAKETEKPYKF